MSSKLGKCVSSISFNASLMGKYIFYETEDKRPISVSGK
jgi:hypothetical protein